MDNKNLKYFRIKLIEKKKEMLNVLNDMKKNDMVNSNVEIENELSNYDNHPADSSGNIYDKELGLSLKGHQLSILNEIDKSLDDVENGTYGICKICGKSICKERLNSVPYAKYCIQCEEDINEKIPQGDNNRSVEEEVLENLLMDRYNSFTNSMGFDVKSNEKFNLLNNVDQDEDIDSDSDEEFVEKVEKISNQEYKNQLPD